MTTLPDPRQAPVVMGIINTTPDSFWAGSRVAGVDGVLGQGVRLLAEGAVILDIGGESTRPGAAPVTEEEELARVVPAVRLLVERLGAVVSVDTRRPGVAAAALGAGARFINDVSALGDPGMAGLAAREGAAVILMHMLGTPATMQQDPHYGDVVAEVKSFLLERVRLAGEAGIARERIWIDPGFGFGKTLEHNLTLFRGLEELAATGYPVVAGISRKSLVGLVTGRPVEERLVGSAVFHFAALERGARILRVHDAAAAADAVAVYRALFPSG